MTSGYAPVKPIEVKVVDSEGNPVRGATVNFSLYNYAELYPIAVKRTDSEGNASLLAGLGDLVAWASDGSHFGLSKVDSSACNTVTLSYGPDYAGNMDFDLTPPAPGGASPQISPEQAAANDRRKMEEDSIRNAYTSTFLTPDEAQRLALETGLDPKRVEAVCTHVRGNRSVIEPFLRNSRDRAKALLLLENISRKDLGDITAEVLADRISMQQGETPDSIFGPYILSPRIANEGLSNFNSLFRRIFADTPAPATPAQLRAWVNDKIEIDSVWNPNSFPMTPEGVWSLKKADSKSKDIFTVAAARSLGIPALINPVNGNVELGLEEIKSVSQQVPAGSEAVVSPASFQLECAEALPPKYYSHFTLSKIENGLPRLQEYPEEADSETFAKPTGIEGGQYLLLTGRRMADGGVLAHAEFFNAGKGENIKVPLTLRSDSTRLSVIGNFNSENLYVPIGKDTARSLLSTTGRGYYVLGFIAPGHEPSAHALNDLSARRDAMEALGEGKIVVLLQGGKEQYFDKSLFPNLPSNLVLGVDSDGALLRELADSLHIDPAEQPVFVIADTFNRVVWQTQGYSIGLGDKIATLMQSLE